ncbi:MAG: ATP-grasp fold amidoligase family protein [Spirochaetota bacterium]
MSNLKIKLVKGFKNPYLILLYFKKRWFYRLLTDKKYIKMMYRQKTGKKLNLNQPETFNEKLQWLKLYDRQKTYTDLVDKYRVREYIKNMIGEKYLIPLYGVYDKYEDIDFNILPEKFVIKPNHSSGDIFICKDKNNIDHDLLRKRIKKWMKKNHYWVGREWVYKSINPKLIVEKYMTDESNYELKDYKFHCFDGEPRIIEVDFDRYTLHKRNFYNKEWKLLDFTIRYPNDTSKKITKPSNLSLMLEISRKLSQGIPYVRIDLYSAYDKVFFGEITFYHASGYQKITPTTMDYYLGDLINLPE